MHIIELYNLVPCFLTFYLINQSLMHFPNNKKKPFHFYFILYAGSMQL